MWKFKIPIIAISLLTIPINIIQTFQYKEYILHAADMNKEKYWKVFLKQNVNLGGVLWKKNIDAKEYLVLIELVLKDFSIKPNSMDTLFSINTGKIPDFNKVNIIQVSISNDYKEEEYAKISLSITDSISGNLIYEGQPYLLCFANDKFNKLQTGVYNYEIPPSNKQGTRLLNFKILSGQTNVVLNKVSMKFLSRK